MNDRRENENRMEQWLDEVSEAERVERDERKSTGHANAFWTRLESRLNSTSPRAISSATRSAERSHVRGVLSRGWFAAAAAIALVCFTLILVQLNRAPEEDSGLVSGEGESERSATDLAKVDSVDPELLDELDVLMDLDSAVVSVVVEVGPDALEVGGSLELLQEDEVDELLALVLETNL